MILKGLEKKMVLSEGYSKLYHNILRKAKIKSIDGFADEVKYKKLLDEIALLINSMNSIEDAFELRELVDDIILRVSDKEFSRKYTNTRTSIVKHFNKLKKIIKSHKI